MLQRLCVLNNGYLLKLKRAGKFSFRTKISIDIWKKRLKYLKWSIFNREEKNNRNSPGKIDEYPIRLCILTFHWIMANIVIEHLEFVECNHARFFFSLVINVILKIFHSGHSLWFFLTESKLFVLENSAGCILLSVCSRANKSDRTPKFGNVPPDSDLAS